MEQLEDKSVTSWSNWEKDYSFETCGLPEQTWRGLTSLVLITWYLGKEAVSSVLNLGSAGYNYLTMGKIDNKFKNMI